MQDIGYLQHGDILTGPFRTETVRIRHLYADNWQAYFEGRWRNVHIQVKRCYVVFRGKKITILIEGI